MPSPAKKLSNEVFVSKATANVVEAEKVKLAEMDKEMGQLRRI